MPMKLRSGFAILDVKAGKGALRRHFRRSKDAIPVTITGWIYGAHGSDDGISQEFSVSVDKVEVGHEDLASTLLTALENAITALNDRDRGYPVKELHEPHDITMARARAAFTLAGSEWEG